MRVLSKVAVLGAACAVVWVARSGSSTNAPVLALKRSAETGTEEPNLPSPLDADPEQLEIVPAARVGAALTPENEVAKSPLTGPAFFRVSGPADFVPSPKDEQTLPTYTLAEAPPVPDLPGLVTEPLEFEFFEPPYDARAIPQAVLLAALESSREESARSPPSRSTADDLATMPEHHLETYLAVATLDSGVQAWVHLSKRPSDIGHSRGELLLFNPSTGELGPQRIHLETRWSHWTPDDISEQVGQADLDLDGHRELVVHDFRHNGNVTNDHLYHWFEIDGRLRPERRFLSLKSSLISWRGWNGSFETRLIPVSANELWAQAWYEPYREGERVALGHTVYHREGPGADYVPVYQVINPDAPGQEGDGFATWMPGKASGLSVGLGWR